MTARPPVLILAIGNPSRGDDALGPMLLERVERACAAQVAAGELELQTDFQLQIEHALDLTGRERVIFVDASVRAEPPFRFDRVLPRADGSVSTHAVSPAALLDVHRQIAGEPPEAWVLAIRGERFELGEPLSATAAAHLDAAERHLVAAVRSPR